MIAPILADGHRLPSKPCYWAIQIRDAKTKKLITTRSTYGKFLDPQDAAEECFGIKATPNLTFFNLGTTITEMRKTMRKLPEV